MLIEQIKIKLKVEGVNEDEIKQNRKYTVMGGGGGKSGGGATQQAPSMMTTTTLGNELDIGVEELTDDTIAKDETLNTKKKGTRGLQIPLAKGNQTTTTAASTGVQV